MSGEDCCGIERQQEAEVDEGRKEGEFTHSLSHARFLFFLLVGRFFILLFYFSRFEFLFFLFFFFPLLFLFGK